MIIFRQLVSATWVIAASTLLPIFSATCASAQTTYTWSASSSGNWGDGINWSSNPNPPSSGTTTVLNFNGSTSYTATDNISGAFALNQMAFNGSAAGTTIAVDLNSLSGASGITLGGSSPSISLSSTNVANVAFTAATTLTLAAAATITNSSGNGALLTISGNINNGSNLLTFNGSSNIAINGVIGNGAGGLTVSGTGLVQLNAVNTYTGPTTITSGTLQLGVANALNGATAVTLGTVAGTTFDLNGNSVTIASLAGGSASGGNVTLGTNSATTLTVNGTASTSFGGNITGSGSLVVAGISTLALTGAGSTFAGATIENGATLKVTGADSAAGSASGFLGAVPSTATNNIFFNGGTLLIGATGTTLTSTRSIVLGAGGGTINTNAIALVLNNAFSGAGAFTKTGSGTLTLDGSLGAIDGLSVIGPGSTSNTLNLGGQSVTVNGAFTITGTVNGTSAIAELPSTLTNFSGLTVNGPVNIGIDSAATITAAAGAVINLNAGINTIYIGDKQTNGTGAPSTVVTYAATFTATNAASVSISGANLQIGGGVTFSGAQSGTLSLPNGAASSAVITVAAGGTLQVGGGSNEVNKVTGRIVLNDSTTTISAPYMDIGERNTSGFVAFNTGITYSTPGGVLILSGVGAGGQINIDVGRNAASGSSFGIPTSSNTISAFDMTGGALIGPASNGGFALIGALRLGFFDGASMSGSGTGLFVIDGAASMVQIASVELAHVNSPAANPLNTRGVFTVNNGLVSIGSGGIIANGGTAIGGSQVNIFGGTLNLQGYNIGALNGLTGSTIGAGLNLTGGTLLNAGAIGTTGANFNQSGGTLALNMVGTTAIAGSYNVTSTAPGVAFTATNTTTALNYGEPAVGGSRIVLDSVTAGGPVAVTAASLNRTGFGTLNIIPAGGSLGTNETVTFTTSPATIPTTTSTNLVPVYVVAQTNGANNTSGTYLTHTANGLVPITYSPLTDITQATVSDVFDANGTTTTNATLSSALNLLALRSSVAVDVHGNVLTIGSGTGSSGVLLNGGAIVDTIGGGGLSFGGAEAVIYAGSGAMSTISATITGTGGLTFFGSAANSSNAAGTLSITSNNSTTLTSGVFNINGGILAANNTSGSATGSLAINVNSGGTLGGSGGVAGTVTVGCFGTVVPGNGSNIGTLSLSGSTVFARESTLAIKLNSSGSSDSLKVIGSSTSVTFQYGSILSLIGLPGFNPAQSSTYTIVSMANGGTMKSVSLAGTTSTVSNGTIIGSYVQGTGSLTTDPVTIQLAPNFASLSSGAMFQFEGGSNNSLQLIYTAPASVPEPSHVLLICCGALLTGWAFRSWRRCRSLLAS